MSQLISFFFFHRIMGEKNLISGFYKAKTAIYKLSKKYSEIKKLKWIINDVIIEYP